MGGVGGGEDGGPGGLDICGPAVVDVGGGVQAEPAVTVLVVVPAEEVLAVGPGGLDGGEAAGEAGPVFQGLELGFGVGVVVADVRPGMTGRPGRRAAARPAWTSSRSPGRRGWSAARG